MAQGKDRASATLPHGQGRCPGIVKKLKGVGREHSQNDTHTRTYMHMGHGSGHLLLEGDLHAVVQNYYK